jgi:serpin B
MRRLSAGLLAAGLTAAAALLVIGGTALTSKAGGEEGDHAQTTVAAAPQDLPALVAGTNAFSLDLFKTVRSESQNVVLSPYSISTALAMTYAGANGSTASQMATVLHFTVPQDRLPAAFQELAENLVSASASGAPGKSFTLSIANSLWGQEDFPFLRPFLDVLQKQYGSPLRKLDFAKSSENARQTINDWVKDETKGKIADLLPAGSLDATTRLVLANAVYFKADWQSPFAHEETSDRDFRLVDGSIVTVPTMAQTSSFGYAKAGAWEAVELPYQGERYSMVTLLPQASLADSLPGLTAGGLSSLLKQLTPTQISLEIPKWTYRSGFSLKDALTTLGMADAFADADFSGMDGRKDIVIDDVYHKAFVAVDEKGTEAAAATGVVMRLTAVLTPAPQVKFDRPFLYLIRDRQTEAILFIGQVTDPAAPSTE